MKKIEREILLAAYGNHKLERRIPANWRVAIRAHITQDPVELSAERKMINGINENNWMRFSDLNTAKNLVSDAKNKLEGFLKSHHVENIEPGRTANIRPEIFLKLGYVFVLSNRFYEKLKADDLMQEWKKLGLNTFILAELPPDADLFSSEALGLTKYADLVKTVHLVRKGFSGRIPGSVEGVIVGEKKAVIEEAKKTVDTAFQALEKEGLAVRIRGFNLCFSWSGLALTRAGVAMAEKIKEGLYQEFLAEQAAKAEKQCKIKCLSCGEVLLQTTIRFRSDKAVTGDMIELLPNLSQSTWVINFGSCDTGEAITCPNCGVGLISQDSGRFQEGTLIPEDVKIESEEEEAGVDILGNFISERCVSDPNLTATASELYDAYESWVVQDINEEKRKEENLKNQTFDENDVTIEDKTESEKQKVVEVVNEEPISKKAFGMALAERGFSASRASGGVRMWIGIGLK